MSAVGPEGQKSMSVRMSVTRGEPNPDDGRPICDTVWDTLGEHARLLDHRLQQFADIDPRTDRPRGRCAGRSHGAMGEGRARPGHRPGRAGRSARFSTLRSYLDGGGTSTTQASLVAPRAGPVATAQDASDQLFGQ